MHAVPVSAKVPIRGFPFRPRTVRSRSIASGPIRRRICMRGSAFFAFRRATPALRTGSITLEGAPDTVLAYTRCDGDQRILCVFNLSMEEAMFPIGEAKQLDAPEISGVVKDGFVHLPPFGIWFGS